MFSARGYKFRARLTTNNLDVAPKITNLQVKIDMPDIVQSDNDISFTGTQVISFPTGFYTTSVPAVSTTVTGLSSGDFIEVSGKTNKVFTITAKDSTNTILTTPTVLDYVARGFGKEI